MDGVKSGMRFAAIAEVRAYWEALREGDDLPRRDRIYPRGLAGALSQVFMAERVAPGIARFRLAGMEINDLMGMEVRGMPLTALFDTQARAAFSTAMEAMFANSGPLLLALEAERGLGRPALAAQMLLLPLRATREDTHLMLGCLALDGTPGRAPRRFALTRTIENPAQNPGATRPASLSNTVRPMPPTVPKSAPEPVPGFAESTAGFTAAAPARPGSAERPYLRLVRSAD